MTRLIPIGLGIALAAGVATSQTPPPAAVPARPPSFAQTTANEVCAGCHGPNLAGGRGPGLTDATLLARRTDAQLRDSIANGVPGTEMPGFKDAFTDDQIWQLVAHIRTSAAAKTRPVFVPDPAGRVVEAGGQKVRIDVVARGLDTPWGLAFLPDGRLLVTERAGRLRIIDRRGRLLPEPVKGLPVPLVIQDGGYFDIAPHPDYARNGWIYFSYAERLAGSPDPAPPAAGQRPVSPPSMTVLVRGKLNGRGEWVDNQILYRAPASLYTANGSHYGSRFLFDRKGHVFYSLGERGDMANAQNLSTPLGKIHRINDDGSVPKDNPFVGRLGAVPTIWSYGHRNPQGLAFDPATGLLWESEHGPNAGDEINIIERGGNYGWGVVSQGIQPGITRRSAPGMIDPIAYYIPRIAPSGITFYTGNRYPAWKGNLFVAGLGGQQFRRLAVNGRTITEQEPVFEAFGRVRASTIGPDGLLYVLLQNPTGAGTGIGLSDNTPGMVIKLVPAP
jgi:glucose/arabinose dehydrogenase